MKRFLPLCAIPLLLIACRNNSKKEHTANPSGEPAEIISQGARIDYNDSKSGDTTLLFVHGWCINKTYWDAQIAHFSPKYRVVAIDLPGFGQSGKERDTWSMENYSKDIETVIGDLGLKNVILVGHSMSGGIVLETALEHPKNVLAIVGIDNFKDAGYEVTPASKKEADEFYKKARENYKQAVGPAVINQWLFAKNTDSTIMHRVTMDILTADPAVSISALEANDNYPLGKKLAAYKKTLYLINSSFPDTDTTVFDKLHVRYKLYKVEHTGHYPMLERPDVFNTQLENILADISAGK